MVNHESNIIAWLVPTARGTSADKAALLSSNSHLTTSLHSSTPSVNSSTTGSSPSSATSSYLHSRLPLASSNTPTKAIALSFTTTLKRPGSFIIGTDPMTCDIVLPATTQGTKISPQHCSLGFDAEGRLVMTDFSELGSSVWYGWDCAGDKKDYTWILSPGPTSTSPSTGAESGTAPDPTGLHWQADRTIIDIQGVRFQLIVNDHSANPSAYHDKVKDFCKQPAWAFDLTPGWDRVSVKPVMPLFTQAPLHQHIFVKSLDSELIGGMYLWDMARPWEPLVKAC